MLPLSLRALYLAIIGAYAKPMVRTATGLEISLSTLPGKVKFVSKLRVVATVKNIRDEDLKVPKLGTVLDNEHPTRSFFVTKDGKQVPFTGIEVCAYSPPSTLPSSRFLACPLIHIYNYGSHRFQLSRSASLRDTGRSSPPARV